MLIAAAVPVSVTVPVPLLATMPPGVATVMVPFDTVSTVVSVSPVFGVSATETPASGIAVFSSPLSAGGTLSDTIAVSATVIAAVWAPELWPPPSVVVTDSVSVPWKLWLPV